MNAPQAAAVGRPVERGGYLTDYARLYAGQDYMTPGAAQTVDIIADSVPFDDAPWLLTPRRPVPITMSTNSPVWV